MGILDKAGMHMELDVCMLGPRGVGKTSVLTAIFDDAKRTNGLGTSALILSAKSDTRRELSEKKLDLQRVFEKRVNLNDQPEAGIEASSSVHTFNFEFGLLGRTSNIDLNITDYPGEYLQSNADFVNERINKSAAVIIAIDSPYLMEEGGRYNEEKNQVRLIYDYLKNNSEAVASNKLVMLVPLKCEKYFETKRMDELNGKVRAVYAGIIDLLKTKDNVAVVIAPILTMGGVVFDRFENDGAKHIAHYRFKDENARFTPMFCVQPIYYLLSFMVKLYKTNKNSVSGLFGRVLQSVVSIFRDDQDLFYEAIKLEQYRLEDINGYSVVCGKDLFYSKEKR